MSSEEWLQQALAGQLQQITARELGLRGRALLHVDGGRAVQIIQRRSRVLRKDTASSLLMMEEAQRRNTQLRQLCVLIVGAGLCSKARALWEERSQRSDPVRL